MKKRVYVAFMLFMLAFLTACSAQEGNPESGSDAKEPSAIRETYREAYEKDPEGIDFFCETMKVAKNKITLSHNFTDEHGLNCFDIGVEGDEGKSGTYITYRYYDEEGTEYKRIVRKVSKNELDNRGIRVPDDSGLSVYEIVQDSIWETNRIERELIQPEIDDSEVREYTETRVGTNPIWGAYSGYIGQSGNYSVSYAGDASEGWRRGVFKNGKWKTWQMPELEKGTDSSYFAGSDDRIWYYGSHSDTKLKLYDKKGKKIGEVDTSAWVKKHNMENRNKVKVTVVSDAKAIFYFEDNERTERSFLVDITTGKLEKEYDFPVYGTCYGDYAYEYSRNGKDVLQIVNWKTGEISECLDLSGIRQDYFQGGEYIVYSDKMHGFCEVYNDDIPGIEAWREPIRYCVFDNTLYFSYFSGVYRYQPEKKKLEKILDGKKQPKFQNMYGDFDIGKNESIYLLGALGGGDDEGATDFLYLTKKK